MFLRFQNRQSDFDLLALYIGIWYGGGIHPLQIFPFRHEKYVNLV